MRTITTKTGEPLTLSASADGEMYRVTIGDECVVVRAYRRADGGITFAGPDGRQHRVSVTKQREHLWVSAAGVSQRAKLFSNQRESDTQNVLEAPMPGKVLALNVAVGDQVIEGETLLIIEAMKMEHALKATYTGVVQAIHTAVDEMVNPGKTLIEIEGEIV